MNDRIVEDIKNRVDLIEIVRKYATIKKSGKNYSCKSPFRNERTPSFSISPEKQVWYDFGASEGGDVISFIEKIENCNFMEAVEQLADIAGIDLPKNFGETSGASKQEKNDIFSLHEAASGFFATLLQKDKVATAYCTDRHISESMINDWNLGYGGEVKNGLTQYLLKKGFSEKAIAQSGVSFQRDFGDKQMMDRFTNRLIIPVCEPRNGEIIAFTGRILSSGKKKIAKYVNSPENPVYHKSATLFGLDKARGNIRAKDYVILVEGNFDVIFAHDRGFCNTIATCGTALTDDHLRILKRLTKNIYLAFDSDLAGKKATLKATEMLLKMDMSPYIIEVEGAKDFGEFLEKKENAIVLQKLLKSPPSALDFFFDKFAVKNLNETVDGEKKFLDSFFYFLGLVKRPIEIDDFLNRLSKKINRSKSIIEAEFAKFKAQKTIYNKEKYKEETKIRFSRQEHFVGFLSANWEFFIEILETQQEKLSNLFTEDIPFKIIIKKIKKIELNEKEKQLLLGWEMYEKNLSEREDEQYLKEEFNIFMTYLKAEKKKQERLEQARNFKR